jgi:methyltransferase (TIGR00027 family)
VTALLTDVSDTARWVAHLRALESDRPDALFRDPFARRLAGERGKAIAESMPDAPGAKPGAAGFASVLAIRTKVFDELIVDSLRSIGADAVLNLAAGLDARPYRLSVPASLVWIEADGAAILESKTARLSEETPACKVVRRPLDLANASARRELLDYVDSSFERVVVITEGLLVYLEEPTVRALALRSRRSVKRWVLEAVAPEVLERNMRAWGDILRRANAEWKFAHPASFDFYAELGWAPVETRSFLDQARSYGRPVRSDWMLRLLSLASTSFRERVSKMVVYGVVEPTRS